MIYLLSAPFLRMRKSRKWVLSGWIADFAGMTVLIGEKDERCLNS
jgi:hypothetical protein